MSDFFSRLAERAQGKIPVAEPLIPSRFAATPWVAAGDPAALVWENVSPGPAQSNPQNVPVPEPQAPSSHIAGPETPPDLPNFGEQIEGARPLSAEVAEEPKTTEGIPASDSAQDVSFPYSDRHPPAVPEPPASPSTPAGATPPPRASGSDGSGKGGRTLYAPLLHSEPDPFEVEVEGGDYRSGSSDTPPERAWKPSSFHMSGKYRGERQSWNAQEQVPAVTGQTGPGNEAVENPPSPAVEVDTGGLSAQAPNARQGSSVSQELGLAIPDRNGHRKEAAERSFSPDAERNGAELHEKLVAEELLGPVAPSREQTSPSSVQPAAMEPSRSQAPWAEQVEGRRPVQLAPSAPTVRVTIGRVEVRAVQPPTPSQPRPPSALRSPRLTLDDYLRERGGGRS
jgi:hypothetical protein